MLDQHLFNRLKGAVSALVITLTCVPTSTFAANNSDFPELLNDLDEVVARFMDVDVQGQDIQNTRDSNRQEMSRLDSEASVITGLKAQIDNRLAQYNSALATFTAECEGQTLSGAASRSCQSQQQSLADMSASLEADAAELTPRVDDYNEEIEAFNVQDEQLGAQAEILYIQTQEIIAEINTIKDSFSALANTNGDAGMITAVQRCNALEGFKDTLTCLRAVWSLYGR